MKGRTDKAKINPGERSVGITALLEKEYAKKQPQEERVVQAKAVPENSAHEKHNIVVEQTGMATRTSSEKAIRQRILRHEQEAEWVAVALLVVGLDQNVSHGILLFHRRFPLIYRMIRPRSRASTQNRRWNHMISTADQSPGHN